MGRRNKPLLDQYHKLNKVDRDIRLCKESADYGRSRVKRIWKEL